MNPNKLIMMKTQTSNHSIKLVLGGFFRKRGPDRLWIQTVLYILSVMCFLSTVFSASASTTDVLADGVEGGLNAWINMVIISHRSSEASQAIVFITKINTEHTLKQHVRDALYEPKIEEGRVYFNAAFWTWSVDIKEGELIDNDGDVYVLVEQ